MKSYLATTHRPSTLAVPCAVEPEVWSLPVVDSLSVVGSGTGADHGSKLAVATVPVATGGNGQVGNTVDTGRAVMTADFAPETNSIQTKRQQAQSADTSERAANDELTGKPVARGVPPRGRPV